MSHDHFFPSSSISQGKRTEVKYKPIHACIHFSDIRKVGALKTIKIPFERGLAEVKINQETGAPILSEPRTRKKILILIYS